jgi:hypothetical protein
MSRPSPQNLADWRKRAAKKNAIVPEYFEVFPHKVNLLCGNCSHNFSRTLLPNLDEPVFVCPAKGCQARNWVPVRFDLRR